MFQEDKQHKGTNSFFLSFLTFYFLFFLCVVSFFLSVFYLFCSSFWGFIFLLFYAKSELMYLTLLKMFAKINRLEEKSILILSFRHYLLNLKEPNITQKENTRWVLVYVRIFITMFLLEVIYGEPEFMLVSFRALIVFTGISRAHRTKFCLLAQCIINNISYAQ